MAICDDDRMTDAMRCLNFKSRVLCGFDFSESDLRGADFRGADLRGSNFKNSDLREAQFDRCILRPAGFDGVDLRGVKGFPEIEPFDIDGAVWNAVNKHEFDMLDWHSECGSVHCWAGWAVTLHPQGVDLERKFGTSVAAALIYNACSKSERVPNWYMSNEHALAAIRELAFR